jgi:hypothetical protein
LAVQDAQKMQRLRMIRVLFQDSLVDLRGLGESTGLVMLDRNLDRVVDIDWRHKSWFPGNLFGCLMSGNASIFYVRNSAGSIGEKSLRG